jgi:hypothetical protein
MKRGLLAFWVVVLVALAGLLTIRSASSSSGVTCYGVERWPIKTLSDPSAG